MSVCAKTVRPVSRTLHTMNPFDRYDGTFSPASKTAIPRFPYMYPDVIRSPHGAGGSGGGSTDPARIPASAPSSAPRAKNVIQVSGAEGNKHGDEVLLKRGVWSTRAKAICYSSAVAMSLLLSAGTATATGSVAEITVSDSEAQLQHRPR